MKFRDIYDLPPNRNSLELKVEYQIRAIVLSNRINFKQSEEQQQSLWLTIMRDMILESFELSGYSEDGTSKTFNRIREALTGSDFLGEPKPLAGRDSGQTPSEEVFDLFCAVQLVRDFPDNRRSTDGTNHTLPYPESDGTSPGPRCVHFVPPNGLRHSSCVLLPY